MKRRTKEQERELLNKIKRELNPTALIEDLNDVYEQVDKDDHKVSFDENIGQYKIKVGRANMNVTDYLTKQIGMSFEDTKQLVFNRFEMQKSGDLNDKADIDLKQNMTINYVKNEAYSEKQSVRFINNHIRDYMFSVDLIKIKYKENGGTLRSYLGRKEDSTEVPVDLVIDVLKNKKAFAQNALHGENIYIANCKDKAVKMLWLDDVPLDYFSRKRSDLTVIETSKGSYQGFMKLDGFVTAKEAKLLRDYVVSESGSDSNAKGDIQPMRLPGFFNLKPGHIENGKGFMVKIIQESFNEVSSSKLLERAGVWRAEKVKEIEELKSNQRIQTEQTLIEQKPVSFKLSDFKSGNQSDNDFAYSRELLKHGRSVEKVKEALLSERDDIFEKKGKYAIDYAERTALNASQSLGLTQQETNSLVKEHLHELDSKQKQQVKAPVQS